MRRAQCAHRHERRVLAARHLHSRQGHHLGVGTIRGVESRGMLVLGSRDCSFPTITRASSNCPPMRRSAALSRKYAGLDDPVIEINLTPNRADCTGVQRHRARSWRRRHRQVQGKHAQAGQRHIPLPGVGQARFRLDAVALPRLRVAAGQRREERPVAGTAAEAPHGDRTAADQRAGRYHQFHHLRPRPAAACVRRRQGARQSDGAGARARARNCSRSTARPMRSTKRCA